MKFVSQLKLTSKIFIYNSFITEEFRNIDLQLYL